MKSQISNDSVIEAVAKKANISLREAMDVFYKSPIYEEISQGVSDMHCRSDVYLAEDICERRDYQKPMV